jgi:DNA segregation ATPase FtsK/SpoIIIE, S-DNA-T family
MRDDDRHIHHDHAARGRPALEVAPVMAHPDNDTRPDLDTDTGSDQANRVAREPGRARHPTGPLGTPDAADGADDGDAGPAAHAPDAAGDGEGLVLVDSPQAQQPPRLTSTAVRASQRQPIIPPWLRSRRELRAAVGWLAGHLAHTAAYHATRSPKYAARLAVRAPRGAARLLAGTLRWTLDAEGAPARQAALRRDDVEQYLKLSRQRDDRVRLRSTITTIAATAVLLVLLIVLLGPWWARWAVAAGLVALLGVLGAPADRPLLDTAVVTPRVARLTSEVVVRALGVLGLAGITQALAKNPRAISFPSPITRDGPGWRADVDLPPGVTAAEVIDRRDKLASGLGRPLGCVWPEGNHEVSPGRLVLWVGDQDMAATRQPAWPLLRSGTVDLFRPFPFGTDPRGRTVAMELAYSNLLIGSIPGAGKTFSLRVPLLAAALDPRAELWCFELKGTGDLDPIGQVSARYASGGDDDIVEHALLALRDLREQCTTRAATIKQLPKHLCPENKITPQLAGNLRLGLQPLVVAIDECQELFTHPDLGKEAGELAERIIKLGRALGIMLLLATQRPDARSLPTGLSANVGTRFCLRVMGQLENDMILGTSAYKNGIRATMFTARDKGVGYLVGGPDPQITRVFYVDNPATERVIARARAARQEAGTLIGHAAGEPPSPPAHRAETLLGDILAVIPPSEAKVWSETVLERLADLRPDLYGTLTRDQLTAALKPYGITTGQVWGTTGDGRGANRRGIDRQAVADAATQRDRRRAGGSPP